MAEIPSDIGHALSRLDQHRNRRQLFLISTPVLSLISFSGISAPKFSKKILSEEIAYNEASGAPKKTAFAEGNRHDDVHTRELNHAGVRETERSASPRVGLP
jgi:hypothetical protein